jgi:hypothetical protein
MDAPRVPLDHEQPAIVTAKMATVKTDFIILVLLQAVVGA